VVPGDKALVIAEHPLDRHGRDDCWSLSAAPTSGGDPAISVLAHMFQLRVHILDAEG